MHMRPVSNASLAPISSSTSDSMHITEELLDSSSFRTFAQAADMYASGMHMAQIFFDFHTIGATMLGLTMPQSDFMNNLHKNFKLSAGLRDAYKAALEQEQKPPAPEVIYDFAMNDVCGCPKTKVTVEPTPDYPSMRVWKLADYDESPDDPTLILVGPNSGTDISGMGGLACAARKAGYRVIVIGPRAPRYLAPDVSCRFRDSVGVLTALLHQYPGSTLVGPSQAGFVIQAAAIQAATQNAAPHSIAVLGTPAEQGETPTLVGRVAQLPSGCIEIKQGEGKGRWVVPGQVVGLFLGAPKGKGYQAVPEEYADDTKQIFRQGLPRFLAAQGLSADMGQFTGRMALIAGAKDDISPPRQVFKTSEIMTGAKLFAQQTLPDTGHFDLLREDVGASKIIPIINAMRCG